MRIDTKTGRAALVPRREPYWHVIRQDRALGYRKTVQGPGTWVARHRTEDGKRTYGALGEVSDEFDFTAAHKAALAWFAKVPDRDIKSSKDVETVAGACAHYVEERRTQKGERTAHDIEWRLQRSVVGGGGKKGDRHKPAAIASMKLDNVRRRHLVEWRDGLLAGGMQKPSVNKMLVSLKAALHLAIRDRYVSADLALELKNVKAFPGADKRRDLYLDLTQRRALLAACTGAVRDLVQAVALTGARAGELINAKRSAFDSRTETLKISGKTGGRAVPLSPAGVELFERLAKNKLPHAFLLTRDDGEQWRHSDWDDLVREAAKAAKLPSEPRKGVCLYTLRHSFITETLLGGMPTLEVARMVGTSVQMIEKHYGHLVASAARERLAKVAML